MRTSCWILLALALVLLPLGINFLILIPQQFPVAGNGADWLSFWTTYISAMASFAMVFITWRTLQQSKVQQEDLKMQWEDEQRARLNFTIDIAQEVYVLKIRNVGKSDAYKIKIKINEEFIDCITAKSIKEIYAKLQKTSFCIESGQTRFIYISRFQSDNTSTLKIGDEFFSNKDINKWIETNKNQEIVITGTYCEKYQINETLDFPTKPADQVRQHFCDYQI